MEEQPVTVRIYPGELRPVYYTSVLAFRSTPTEEIIRLSLERLQVFEDKSLYELYEGNANKLKSEWTKLDDDDKPVIRRDSWKTNLPHDKEVRFFIRRKEHASLVLTEIVSQYISPEVDDGQIEDMCTLEELSEQTILTNLRGRFSNKNIYTYVGSILISINPYYYYSVYNPKYTTQYVGKSLSILPPHIFAIADNAYHSMLNEKQNQSVIISGESGAGKTESTKFILHHLMSLSAKLDDSQSLQLITLGTGPVLESFGNAMTVANNNSSRFGKFIQVNFKENGVYLGASIEKYLLEKSRIISQASEERNYHVFYYLLLGAETELKKQLQLLNIDQYKYLTQGSSVTLPNGSEEYHRLRQSLSMLGFTGEIQIGMFTVLSAILHIGNITFVKKESEEAAQVENMDCLRIVSDLLQVDKKTLWLALTTRKSKAGGSDCIVLPYRVEEALATRDSLAKALYGALFHWIVEQVNISLDCGGKSVKGYSIGVLDIFGFEVFQKNSFEQFCINFANEQLQQYFNKHIFKLEQAEYESEGIEWSSVTFVDNQECLDLIAKKPTGLLPLLDEECSFPGADDHSLFQKFEQQHKNNPHYRSPQLKLKDPQFTILHYASDVSYSIQGFRGKNRDLMRQDIIDVLKTSRRDLVRIMIGLSPYAIHRWRTAYLKIVAAMAFREYGKYHREKVDGRLAVPLPFKFRAGSSPNIFNDNRTHNSRTRNLSEELTAPVTVVGSHDSPDAFPLEHGDNLKKGHGMRTSRSYDFLNNATKDTGEDHIIDNDQSSDASSGLIMRPSPRVAKKPPANSNSRKYNSKESTIDQEDSRSRLPSISSLQEKIKRHWPMAARCKEAPEARDNMNFSKVSRSAPRVREAETIYDTRMLRSLTRHGPSKTVGGQFQASLTSLMERLEKTNPFFIRCIKSNGQKAPCQFDDELVLCQLRYTGIMETVKIRKAGYPVRTDFEDFYEKYQFLMGPRTSDLASQIKLFLKNLGFDENDIQIGKNKVFMRDRQKQALQNELGDKVLARIVKIQRWMRRMMLRCRYLLMRRSCITIQCAVRCFLAKKAVDKKKRRVCSAVLIQSAWRSHTPRKNFVLLKQAAIILQTHWRGLSARKQFATLLTEDRERKAKEMVERQRLEEEIIRKNEEMRKLEEERAEIIAKELQLEQERQCALEPTCGDTDPLQTEQSSESKQAGEVLDAEVRDVLSQFDMVVNALNIDSPHDLTPSPRPQSPSPEYAHYLIPSPRPQSPSSEYAHDLTPSPRPQSPSPEYAHDLTPSPRPQSPSPEYAHENSDTSSEKTNRLQNGTITEQELILLTNDVFTDFDTLGKASEHTSLSCLPKIEDIKNQLYSKGSDNTEMITALKDTESSRAKVQDLIVRMFEGEPTTPEPSPAVQDMSSSNSVQTKITNLTSNLCVTNAEKGRRSYTPPPVRRKVMSPFLEKSRSKSVDRENVINIDTTQERDPLTKAEKYSNKVDLTSSITPELSEVVERTTRSTSNREKDKSVEDISEPSEEHKSTLSEDKVYFTIRDDYRSSKHSLKSEDKQEKPGKRKMSLPDTRGSRVSTVDLNDITLTFDPELETSDKEVSSSSQEKAHVELIIGVKENGLFSAPPRIIDSGSSLEVPVKKYSHYDRLISKNHYDHLPPMVPDNMYVNSSESLFRYRSSSDVTAHRIKPLTDTTDCDMTASEVVPRDYLSSDHYFNSLRNRRAAVSVADPLDVTLHPLSLEGSSEFTKGLSTDEISRLNQRQMLSSPSERVRLFPFHKRHLRLPFRHKGKKAEKERDKLLSPDKDRSNSSTPTRSGRLASGSFKSLGSSTPKKNPADILLVHNFRQTTVTRFSLYPCEVCHKGFTGFMKHAMKCIDCELIVHRHCDDRVPPCKAKIASGSYVTMSRNKVVKKLEDLDDLGRFLLDKISMLSKNASPGSLIDRVFKLSLMEFHTSLISSYSLSLQSSGESQASHDVESKDASSANPRMTITFSQLVNNFSNIFKGIAKREGLTDSCIIAIGMNQIKTLLDEFGKARRTKRRYSASINPSDLVRKTKSGKDIQAKVHKGHRFYPQQFNVATVCEFCSRSIGLLENGEVCKVCGYTCHEGCFKKTNKKCEGKARSKGIPEYNPSAPIVSCQFGKSLENLVPPNTIKVPPLLETCFSYIESSGLYSQGVYRKSAGVSSKRAVRSALEEDPEGAKLDNFSVHAVASAVGSFFRELPEPLLTRDLYVEFLRAMDLTDKKEKMETLHHLISRLPALNHAVFERLIFHLARLAQHQHVNKMNPGNLAIIFAPCLLQGPANRSPDEILKCLEKQTICLEAIIIEQVEKLTATIRGIRTLDSYVRTTTSKLTQLIGQFENTQKTSEADSDQKLLTSTKPAPSPSPSPVRAPPPKVVSEEKRKQLTEELEVLERERVQLTVNLPRLEPFFLSEDELPSGDSDKWQSSSSPSPSLSPTPVPSLTSVTRSQRDFSPISEMTEPRVSLTLDLTSDGEERQSRERSPFSPPFSPLSPDSPTIVIGEDGFPILPSVPLLTHLTKNRTSKKPSRRLPSDTRKVKTSGETHILELSTPISPLVKKSHHSAVQQDLHDSNQPYARTSIFKETTV